jgi:peptide methionine sulfoxide reductase MsrA
VGDPLLFFNADVFDQRNHGITAAKSEQADLREGQKQFQHGKRLLSIQQYTAFAEKRQYHQVLVDKKPFLYYNIDITSYMTDG